ncbi:hypothetical protein [Halomontanus rarus]|uniref:hypothetical protein n=1 Tax=Halomontanus rarus TaxID=3034020 RepID=UPI0023E7F70E|nr:hypothetical protein [Halovivax sp. TS33]
MVKRRTVLKNGIVIGTAGLVGLGSSGTVTVGADPLETDDELSAETSITVNGFESGAYPGQNELEEWSEHVAFEDASIADGALRLEYDDGGFLASNVMDDLSEYSHLVLVVRGDDGGEEDDIQLEIGSVEGLLSELTDDSIGTEFSPVVVDLEEIGVDRSFVDDVQLNFWQYGSGAVEIEEIAFVGGLEEDPGDPGGGTDITGETTLDEFYPEHREEDVLRAWTEYIPGDLSSGHGSAGSQVNWPDAEKADEFDVDLDAIENRHSNDDATLTFDDMGTQALGHVQQYEAEGFPRQASAKLLPRLSLLPDETEALTYHNEPQEVWDETAGPIAATNDPDQLIQDPWPPDARSYEPDQVAIRDRAHDQPQHEDQEGWTTADNLPDDRYYDDDNPIHDIADGIHPATGESLGGDGFTANAPMEVEAKIHVENDGFWYQVLNFKNVSNVPYYLNAAVIMWIGPAGANGDLRTGHYNNEQRPQPGYGHPQRDIIAVSHDEERALTAYAVRLAFHDEPYNMRTAYPNQRWGLEQGTSKPEGHFETAEERQELVDTMAETCHVEIETDMDRNDDLLDAVNLRNRMSN